MSEITINDCWNTIGIWGDESPRCEKLQSLIHCRNCEIYSHAGSQLLDRPAEPEYLDEWQENLSQPRKEKNLKLKSALSFRIGDEWFALASKYIDEITHCDKHHSLPHKKSNVLRGLVNVRGELLLNVSLGYLFKLTKSEAQNDRTNERYVIINDGEEKFAFPATEVREIVHYDEENIEPTPSTLSEDTSCFVKGIISHKKMDIGLLDSELIFSSLHKNI